MENNTNQLSSNLCKKNCGFFGNPAFDGYCSKCYKEHVKRQNSGTAAGRVTPTSITSVNSDSSAQLSAETLAVVTSATTVSSLPMETSESNTTTTSTTTSNVTFNLISTNDNDSSESAINNKNNELEINNVILNNLNATASNNVQTAKLDNLNVLPDVASSSSVSSMENDSNNSNKKRRTRCNVDTCKRKLGLTGFDCRCGNVFCSEHRYSDKHNCQFDYKQLGQEQIRKNNPVVVGEKIQKL